MILVVNTVQFSSEFNHLVSNTVKCELQQKDDKTLSEYYQKCMDQAHMDGVSKHEVSKIVLHILDEKLFNLRKKDDKTITPEECKINRTLYFRVSSKLDYRDPNQVRNTKFDPPVDQENSSLYAGKVGSFTGENQKTIRSLIDFIQTIKLLRDYLHNNPFTLQIPKNVLDDILTRINAYNVNASDYLNNKQTVPLNSQMIFMQCYNECSDINNLFGLFFDEIKRVHVENRKNTKKTNQILTSKELKKYSGRELTKLHASLEFTSSNEARLNGFYGQQCPNCKGFRTNVINGNSNRVYCIQCHNTKGRESMPREHFVICPRCRFIITSKDIKGKCPHCEIEIIIPAQMK